LGRFATSAGTDRAIHYFTLIQPILTGELSMSIFCCGDTFVNNRATLNFDKDPKDIVQDGPNVLSEPETAASTSFKVGNSTETPSDDSDDAPINQNGNTFKKSNGDDMERPCPRPLFEKPNSLNDKVFLDTEPEEDIKPEEIDGPVNSDKNSVNHQNTAPATSEINFKERASSTSSPHGNSDTDFPLSQLKTEIIAEISAIKNVNIESEETQKKIPPVAPPSSPTHQRNSKGIRYSNYRQIQQSD
jgi:hypothetical protein